MAEKSERAQREEKILSFWKENKIFEKTLKKKSPKGEFVFYDGPPFATGLPHYGHILPGTIKDVIPRYKTMQGYRVLRRWGWDCHGLPIENLVEKELGLETKKDIEKFGIAEFNKRARASVLQFEQEWKEIIPRTGRWIDMENAYKTMDSSYTESVWWSFKTLYDKNLIYQSFKSMHLCPHCETTLSNFEVNQGYKDITDLAVTVELELKEKPNTYFLVWTTTPWTLPGNVALAINPEIEYVEVTGKVEGNTYIMAFSMVQKVFGDDYKILKKFLGKDLVGKKYKTLFDYYQTSGEVYAAEFVSADEGTGIVHIAPAFGEDDYNLSIKHKLPFVQHVETDGRFKPEVIDFAGELVKPKDDHQATDIKIIKYLAGKNLLFAKERIIHSYPHCWRCDTPLLNYATYSWFLKVTEIKDKLVKNNQKVGWVPKDIRDGRFGKWLEGARDWAISRSRFWGTPLPVWQNMDGSKRLVVDSIETLKKYTKTNGNKYFVIRHGEADHNVKNILDLTGDPNDHLTEKGREQVKNAKLKNINLVFSSPFLRSRESAEIISKDFMQDERLREMSPEEDVPSMKRRMFEFIFDIENKYKDKNILILSHQGPLNALTGTLLDTGEVSEFGFVPFPHNEDFELDLHRPYIDDVVLVKDGEEYRRVTEVFDTWYDSGSVPFASREATDFLPADFIAEGLDQTRGWFYTMIVLGTALFNKSPYRQVVVNGLILAEDGKKMSKRLNNYPELIDVLDKYGADALRYYLVSSPAVHAEDLAFSEKGLGEIVKKIISRLENVASFYELYSKDGETFKDSSEHILDQWIETRLSQLINDATKYLENYELDRASRPIADFIDDLSTWYLRRSRIRPEALPKLRKILIELAKVMAPFTPFQAEDVYRRLKGDRESVHLESWPKSEKIDKKVLNKMDEVRKIVSMALEARSKANIKVRQPLNELRIKNTKLNKEFLELIQDELNVKKITVDKNLEQEIELDTNLTSELIEEGKLRDAIRAVQEWRKEQNLKPGEKAKYDVPVADTELFEKHGKEIKRTTNIEF